MIKINLMGKRCWAFILSTFSLLSLAVVWVMTPHGFTWVRMMAGGVVEDYFIMLTARAMAVLLFMIVFIFHNSRSIRARIDMSGYAIWSWINFLIAGFGLLMAAVIMGGVR